jgi:hypothetical protein
MPDRSDPLIGTLSRVGGWLGIFRCIARIDEIAGEFRALDDAAVLARCRELIDAPKVPEDHEEGYSIRRLAGRKLTEQDASAIALGCEAFARFPPAGIAAGTRLYPEQVQAAAQLVRGSLVQMDTGEGKTFALMVAALALLRVHAQIYVVTANPYLALRDAGITAPYWAALGVRVGVVLPDYYEPTRWPGWDATVVYTTAGSLIFECMTDEMGMQRATRKIRRGALLVDEVDAVLLDQLQSKFAVVRNVAGARKDWGLACDLAMQLTEDHVKRDPRSVEPWVYLTAAGQAEVVRLSGSMRGDAEHLQLYRDVELAYAGLREAVEGRDYEVVTGTVVPIDPKSGWRTLSTIPQWVAPLAAYRGLHRSLRRQTMNVADGLATLLRFDHFAGASGTLIGEAIDYLLIAGLPTVAIPPRNARYKGMRPDLFFSSFDRVRAYISEVVAEQVTTRPILVVTSSSVDAYQLAADLQEAVPEGVRVRYALGDTFGEQELFEQAGHAGVVVVSTRQAGRGVDIKLDEMARQNGGSLLILVGHAVQKRLDRQLLGRVGRSGDPYIAYFCNHPTDGMLNLVGGFKTLLRFSAADGYMESKAAARGIAGFQSTFRRIQLQSFATSVSKIEADAELFGMLRRWWRLAQESFDNWNLTSQFVDEAVRTYISYHVPGVTDSGTVADNQAMTAASTVMAICGRPEQAKSLEHRLVGQEGETARSVLTATLTTTLQQAMTSNIAAMTTWQQDYQQAAAASIGLYWLSALRRRVAALAGRLPDRPELVTDSSVAPEEAAYAENFSWPAAPVRTWIRQARSAPPLTAGELDSMSFSADLGCLRPLVVAAVSIRPGNGAVEADLAMALARAIVRAEDTLRVLAARVPDLSRRWVIRDRTPAEIVHETIVLVADLASSHQDRLGFDLWQRQIRGVRYQNAYLAGMQELRKVCEAKLVEEACRNLRIGADSIALDDLFAGRDDRVATVDTPRLPVGFAGQFVAPLTAAAERRVPRNRDELIDFFIEGLRANGFWRRLPRREFLVPALNAILGDSPQATMSTPEGVADALDKWRKSPVRLRMLPWRRHQVDRIAREFLKYMHDQGLCARLPSGISERTLPLRRRVAARLRAPGMQLGAMMVAAALAVTAALAFTHVHVQLRLSGVGRLADLCLTAGLLGAGMAIGPALAALTGTAMVKWLLHGFEEGAGVYPFERILLAGISVAAAVVLSLQHGRSWLAVAIAVVLLAASALVLGNLVWNLENIGRIRVTAGVISVATLGVALPAMARIQPRPVLVLAAAGALSAVAWRLLPVRLPVNSMQWSDQTTGAADIVLGSRTVKAHVGWTAHAYALIAGLLVGVVTHAVAWVTPLVYVLVYLLWTRQLARSVTRKDRWIEQLRRVDQGYAGSPKRPDIDSGLTRLQRQFFSREAVIGVVYVAVAVAVGGTGRLLGGPTLQIGLIAGFLGISGVEFGIAAAASVLNIGSFERAGANPEDADSLSDKMMGDIQDILRRFGRRLGLVVAGYLILAKISEVIGVGSLIKDIAEHVHRLF